MNKKNKKSILKLDLNFNRIKLRDKAIFAKNLSTMLKSGLSIIEALEILEEQASGKFKKIINNIKKSVLAGNPLSLSMAKFPKIFSSFFINSLKAGESSGTLEQNLKNIAKKMMKEKELIDKIKGAMFYPLIILILSFIIGLTLSFFVLPKITPIFSGLNIDLPISTRFLIWFSTFIEDHTIKLLVLIFIIIIAIIWLLKQKFFKPILHFIFLHLPVIKKISYHKNLAQFSSTLGMLLKSGLNIDKAMDITADTVDNYYYKKSLKRISNRIGQGIKISENLSKEKKYFPKLTISMIKVGERSGNLEEELLNLSDIYDDEVNNATKILSIAIEPILLIFIGLLVGGLAISIITPIYQITGNI